jgi:hypothetical protein
MIISSLHAPCSTAIKPATCNNDYEMRLQAFATAPTHTAIYQHNYCVQHTQYVANLEEYIHQLEAKNAQLQIDLEAAHIGQATSSPISSKYLDNLFFSIIYHLNAPRPHAP